MRLVVILALLVAPPASAPRRELGAQPPTAGADLAAVMQAIRQAREACRAPTEGELKQAKADAIEARQRLSDRLAELPDGQSTGDELGLPSISEELRRPTPNLPALERAEATLRRNVPGAESDDYRRLCSTLRHYVRLARADKSPDMAEQGARWIDRLEAACARYFADRSAETLSPVAEAYDWLLKNGQAVEALAQVRMHAVKPNHRMRVSAALLNRLVGQNVTRPISSDENNAGARVHVRGDVEGKLSSALVPDEARGVIHVGFHGVGKSGITVYKGRATVRARGLTDITAGQSIFLTPAGFGVEAPRAVVRHQTRGSVVSLNLRCRLLRGLLTPLAARVVSRQQAVQDCQASRRTGRQIEERLRVESARIVKQGNETLDSLGLFAALGPEPSHTLGLRTTARYLEWLGRYADEAQFASPAGPPDAGEGDHALLFQLHESAVNNAQRFLAGRTVNEADFREAVYSTLGFVPADDVEVVARIPATITFAEEEPLRVGIRDGRVVLNLHLQAIGEKAAPRKPYRVTTSYAPRVEPEGTRIVRNGPIAIEPAEEPLSDQLREVLSHFFVAEARAGANRPLAELLAPATLHLRRLTLIDGWLTLALKLEEGAAGG